MKTIVKFHIGRGGRFNNAGHLSFEGVSRIDEGSSYDQLFLSHDETYFINDAGNEVGLTVEEAESGIGTIDQDGAYDTTYTKHLEDVNYKEFQAIKASDEWNKDELVEKILDHYECDEDLIEMYI